MQSAADRLVFDTQVSERRILIVPIHTIKPTSYNPAARTKEGKKLSELVESMRKYGAVYPILITEDREVADGHRRLMAHRMLGRTHIECIVSDVPRDELFGDVNTTQLPMASRGWLEVARGGGKIPAPYAGQYRELLGLIGTYGIDMLIRNGLGMNSLSLCKIVASLDGKYILADLIVQTAAKKLTNRLNAVIRARNMTREEKVSAVDAILSA